MHRPLPVVSDRKEVILAQFYRNLGVEFLASMVRETLASLLKTLLQKLWGAVGATTPRLIVGGTSATGLTPFRGAAAILHFILVLATNKG